MSVVLCRSPLAEHALSTVRESRGAGEGREVGLEIGSSCTGRDSKHIGDGQTEDRRPSACRQA